MKKIQIYHTAQSLLLGLTITLSQVSCESLDQGNLSELAESNLPKSDADAQALVNASYANNITMCTSFIYLFAVTTETTVSGENPNGGGGMLGLLASSVLGLPSTLLLPAQMMPSTNWRKILPAYRQPLLRE